MNKLMSIFYGLIAVLAGQSVFGQEKADLTGFDAIIHENNYAMTLEGGQLSGKGFAWLKLEASAADYFMIGERHGLNEVPEITAALFEALVPFGYRHAALEFGPVAALNVEEKLNEGGYTKLAEFLSSPEGKESVAFLDWVAEAKMAARIHAASPLTDGVLWGVDQEFIKGTALNFAQLRDLASTKEQSALASDLHKKAVELPFVLPALEDAVFEDLMAVYQGHQNPKAKLIIDELKKSSLIYRRFISPPTITASKSNVIREKMMRQRFLTYLDQHADKQGKVMVKLGGTHSAPAIDYRHGRILFGTLVEMLAEIKGQRTIKVLMDCTDGQNAASGQDQTDGGQGAAKACSSWFGGPDATELSSVGSRRANLFAPWLQESGQIVVIDLRPIRNHLADFEFLSQSERRLLVGFDVLVSIPDATASATF